MSNWNGSEEWFSSLWTLLSVLVLFEYASTTDTKGEVLCEIASTNWKFSGESLITCRINDAIDNVGFVISSDRNLSLQGLSIKNNKLVKFLPENIARKFPGLKALEVVETQLELVSEVNFKLLKKLQFLHLPRNRIDTINKSSFKHLVNLEYLNLYGNRIEHLHSTVFQMTRKLKQLYLSHNKFEFLSSQTFSELANLEILKIGNNRLQFLTQHIFNKLSTVREIFLEENSLKVLDDDLFVYNLQLEIVSFANNSLKYVSSGIFDNLSKLIQVDLTNNFCVQGKYTSNSLQEMEATLKEKCRSPTELWLNDKRLLTNMTRIVQKYQQNETILEQHLAVSLQQLRTSENEKIELSKNVSNTLKQFLISTAKAREFEEKFINVSKNQQIFQRKLENNLLLDNLLKLKAKKYSVFENNFISLFFGNWTAILSSRH